ncbi:MAG: Peptidase family M50 [Methanoregula sp. PtaU1.Bin051]|nr:MAG: Peptidase family M50 [Methanoregula sp. PtaU1.Bin051]
MFERISRRERFDLFVAWVAISLAFAIIFIRDAGGLNLILALLFIGISLVTVGIGFIAHEMAHKFTAMRYGYWAEFRKDNMMLLVAVALAALVGVVFAAPGATVIYDNRAFGGGISREQNGKISAAGPITNLLLCIPFGGLLLYGGVASGITGNLVSMIGMMGLQVNAMIAAFNMLPVSVLDGKKVLAWNAGVFVIIIVAAFGTLLLSFYPALV